MNELKVRTIKAMGNEPECKGCIDRLVCLRGGMVLCGVLNVPKEDCDENGRLKDEAEDQ